MKETLNYSRARAAVGALILMATMLVSLPAAAEVESTAEPEASSQHELATSTRDPAARIFGSSILERPLFTFVPCLQFTDSIVRLYSAYFLRMPDQGGFNFWQTEYEAGRWGLPAMSAFFSQSEEFDRLYGSLTDAEFIDLIYQNIFGRPADAEGRDFWLGRMQREGLDRGTVMLNFSESPEYISQTQSATTPAGHFNWYPHGTQFSCGFDSAEYDVKPGLPYLDVILLNFGDDPITVTYEVRQGNSWATVQQSTLQSGGVLQAFGWDLSNGLINGLRFTSTADFSWSVAQSPTITPETRVGWDPASS